MEMIQEERTRQEIEKLLEEKQYTRLRQLAAELNDADIAAAMEEMEEKDLLKMFRILPKSMAADVFSYLEVESQQFIITSLSERDAADIIDNLMSDDAADLLEEMPANVVKKLLASASPDTRRDINHLLRYPEDSAGSIMTVEYMDFKEDYTVADAIAKEQGNVIKLEHNQFVTTNRNTAVELRITMEAFGTEHKNQIMKSLEEEGYRPKLVNASF